ncbi:hypothetical protein Pcinc_033356 [Petrolisthes cinctipes]|uniref:Uncharacterized protein n=1 Tax=Petrolisthes cinctipes TaxID=88211 RepID=A0AAE1ESA0_PETCI|nr:hypothetical protein Pcinc_033356 [Petrolisthes cinctipes]
MFVVVSAVVAVCLALPGNGSNRKDFEVNDDNNNNGSTDARVLMAVVDVPDATDVLNNILECLEAMDTPVMVLEPVGNISMSMTRDARRLERKGGRW